MAGIVGCGTSEADESGWSGALNQVEGGSITINGRQIDNGAIVTFHPKAGGAEGQKIFGTYSSGERDFSLVTEKGSNKALGAPAGEYVVTIQPPVPNAPSWIPAKYGNPATSGLTAEVKKGSNHIPEIKLVP